MGLPGYFFYIGATIPHFKRFSGFPYAVFNLNTCFVLLRQRKCDALLGSCARNVLVKTDIKDQRGQGEQFQGIQVIKHQDKI